MRHFTKTKKRQKIRVLVLIANLAVAGFFGNPQLSLAGSPTLSLSTAKSSAVSGETIPVDIKLDTGANDVVVVRAIIRYNKNLVSVSTSDVVLTGSVFETGNTCLFPNDYSDVSLRNKPCQIISNNTTNGILSITLAMPSKNAPTNPGAQINTNTPSGLHVATVNFHAVASVPSSLNAMGLQFAGTGNYNDMDIIADDGSGTDLATVPAQRSTLVYGDLNSDRTVNGGDFSLLHNNYNNATPGNVADINCDNVVNGGDFSIMHSYYGNSY